MTPAYPLQKPIEIPLDPGNFGRSMPERPRTKSHRHKISGGISGYNIRAEAQEAVKFYAANNVFTGPIRETF